MRLPIIIALVLTAASCGSAESPGGNSPSVDAGGGSGGEGGTQTAGASGLSNTGGSSDGSGGSSGGSGGSSGSSGGSGGSSGSSGGSGGSSGSGGGSGSGGDSPCTNPDTGFFATEFETRSSAVGKNGSFTDECDGQGNLLEYVCEIDSSTCQFPNPQPNCFRITGQVIPTTVDCGSTCDAGACISYCVHPNDEVAQQSIDRATGRATLSNRMRAAVYLCELNWDRPTADYDCAADPVVGEAAAIVAFGAAATFCLSGETSGFGVQPRGTAQQECSYTCTTQ